MANLKELLVNGPSKFLGKSYAQTPVTGSSDKQIATTEFVFANSYRTPVLTPVWIDHKVSDSQLLETESFSWYSGDETVKNSHIDAYNKILEEWNTTGYQVQINANIAGTPSTTEYGVVSNFSDSNYISKAITISTDRTKAFPIMFDFTTGNDVASEQCLAAIDGWCLQLNLGADSKLTLSLGSGTSWDIANSITGSLVLTANTHYKAELNFDGSKYALLVSNLTTATPTVTTDIEITSSTMICTGSRTLYLGTDASHSLPFNGSIDVANSQIGTDWNGIFAKLTTNGFNITTAVHEAEVAAKFTAGTNAYYHILDQDNKRFKLARSTWGNDGMKDNMGTRMYLYFTAIDYRHTEDGGEIFLDNNMANLSEAGLEKLNCSKAFPTTNICSDATTYNSVLKYLESPASTGIDEIKRTNYTVEGGITVSSDGIASGFGNGAGIFTTVRAWKYTPKTEVKIQGSFTWEAPANYSESDANTVLVPYVVNDECWRLEISKTNGVTNIYATNDLDVSTNSKFSIQITDILPSNATFEITDTITTTSRTVQVVVNGKTYSGAAQFAASQPFTELKATIGSASLNMYSDFFWHGSIDLNTFKLSADSTIDYQACLLIPYTLSTTGSKIVDARYRDRVFDLLNQEGTANYYTIDKIEKNVTLPMPEIYGLTNKIAQGRYPAYAINSGYTNIDGHLADYNGIFEYTEGGDEVSFKVGGLYPPLICTFIDGDTRIFDHIDPIAVPKSATAEEFWYNMFIDKKGKIYLFDYNKFIGLNTTLDPAEYQKEWGVRNEFVINISQYPAKATWISEEGDLIPMDHLLPIAGVAVNANGVLRAESTWGSGMYGTANISFTSVSNSFPAGIINSTRYIDENGEFYGHEWFATGFVYQAGKVTIAAGATHEKESYPWINPESVSWIACDNPKVTISLAEDGSKVTLVNTDTKNPQTARWKLEGWT